MTGPSGIVGEQLAARAIKTDIIGREESRWFLADLREKMELRTVNMQIICIRKWDGAILDTK